MNCVYVNPHNGVYWIIDYRTYDPDGDGNSKPDHVRDMLTHAVHHKRLPFRRVLIDTWYAAKDLMLFIEPLGTTYYCPLRSNRLADDSKGKIAVPPYRFAGVECDGSHARQDDQESRASRSITR